MLKEINPFLELEDKDSIVTSTGARLWLVYQKGAYRGYLAKHTNGSKEYLIADSSGNLFETKQTLNDLLYKVDFLDLIETTWHQNK